MKKTLEPIVTLQPDQVIGYWGTSPQGALSQQLAQLAALMAPGCMLHRAEGWAISAVVPAPISEISECSILLSASGLVAPTNSFPADAWVQCQRDRLVLGREPFGKMPLYWLHQDQVIWFASRWQWLLPLLPTPELDAAAIYGYSCFSYVPTPLTPVMGIQAVPAGEERVWRRSNGQDASGESITSQSAALWKWQESTQQLQEEEIAIAELQTLLKNAIHRQIQDLPQEPVGVLLSGGLDSSIVAALLVQAGVQVQAYTLDFGAAVTSEYPYAEQVAAFLQIPLITVDASPRRIREALRPTAQALDLPFGDGVTVPLFLLAQAASQQVRVIFNGEGGDQLFAGWTNKPLIAAGIYQAAQPTDTNLLTQYLQTFHRLWGYEAAIFQPEIQAAIAPLQAQNWLQETLDDRSCPSLLHQLRRANLMLKGAQNIHPRATNLARAQGLQVRSPFCDLDLAEWAFRLSSNLYLQGSQEKYILKRAVESWLPPEIVWRRKRGMGVPLTSWCLNELWHDLGIWLNPKRLQQEGIWHPAIAQQLVSGNLGTIQGRRIGESLWLLLMWQVWQQSVLGESSSAYSFNHPFWAPACMGRSYLQLRKKIND